MMNPFIMKKYSAIVIPAVLTTLAFYYGASYGIYTGLSLMGVGILISILLGKMLLANPFQLLLEGKGLLAITMDSTGIMRPFICALNSPYVKGVVNNKLVEDVYDRGAVTYLSAPTKNTKPAFIDKEGGLFVRIDNQKFNEARMALAQYPVLIWNEQTNNFLTKDFFSEKEKDTFSEHGILFANRMLQKLSEEVNYFARHVVDTTKPARNFLQNKMTWIIIIGIIVLIAVVFGPQIMEFLQGMTSSFGGVASEVSSKGPVIPR